MHLKKPVFILVFIMLSACGEKQDAATSAVQVPFVKTAVLALADANPLTLSGIVRARHETPIAFQVNGRITARWVDAGQAVRAGQPLFKLDPRDLEQSAQAAQADVAAAEAALSTVKADLERKRQMQAEDLISVQTLDRAELSERETRTRLDVAKARLAQALNGLAYASLDAPAAGVLTEVTGEPGQVVDAGQLVAMLAREGTREIELFFPDASRPPAVGQLIAAQGLTLSLRLREVSGAVDPQSRTWRARYSVTQDGQALALGSVVRAVFRMTDDDKPSFEVPIAALDERGEGPQVWQIIGGHVQPVKVEVIGMDTEIAKIRGELTAGDKVIALGTHLLTPGMAVQELAR